MQPTTADTPYSKQTFASVLRAEYRMRFANRRNRRAFFLFFLLSVAIAAGLYALSKSSGPTPGVPFNPLGDAIQGGGFVLIFLLQFFAISSISRELSDGMVSLSLRLVPNRKRLFLARVLFWPTITTILFVLTMLIALPFEIAHRGATFSLLDMLLYQPIVSALFVLLIVFLVHIVRKGTLSLLLAFLLVAVLPVVLVLLKLFWYGHDKVIDALSALTPMGAYTTLSELTEASHGFGSFIGAWAVFLMWLAVLGLLAWRRFGQETAATA